MSDPIVYTCTPRQTRQFIMESMEAGCVPFVTSSPGMGKSSIMRDIAKQGRLALIDHRLSTSPPEDLSGLPRFNDRGRAEFAPFEDLFPLEDTPVPAGMNGWMIFLDEFNSAKKETQAAAYKLLLDKMTGQKKLHEQVWITAAGNKMTDRAIVNPIGTAMQSRVIHLEMVIDFDEWLYDVALAHNYDPRIIAYLSAYRSKLMDFNPSHNEKTLCCPRTWEFMDDLVKVNGIVDTSRAPLFAGTITSGVALDFINFTAVYNSLVTVDQILKDPTGAALPSNNNGNWATVSMMFEHVTEANFPLLAQYADRLPLDMRVLFYRFCIVRHPWVRQVNGFATAAVSLSRYLHG